MKKQTKFGHKFLSISKKLEHMFHPLEMEKAKDALEISGIECFWHSDNLLAVNRDSMVTANSKMFPEDSYEEIGNQV